MRGPEEWPSCGTWVGRSLRARDWASPADRIRLTGPAATLSTT